VGSIVEGPDIREVGNEFGDTDDDLYLVCEGLECFWDIQELFTEVWELFKVALNAVVILGHFSVELKVFLLQWGDLILQHPSWGCESWHRVRLGSGSGSVIFICRWVGGFRVCNLRLQTVVGHFVYMAPRGYSTYCNGISQSRRSSISPTHSNWAQGLGLSPEDL
jgi:hypothetical protein